MKPIEKAIKQGIKIGDLVIYNKQLYKFIGYDNCYPRGYRLLPVKKEEEQ